MNSSWFETGPGTLLSDVGFPLISMLIFLGLIALEKWRDRRMKQRMNIFVQIILYGSLALSVFFFLVHLVARFGGLVDYPPRPEAGAVQAPAYVSPFKNPDADSEADMRWAR